MSIAGKRNLRYNPAVPPLTIKPLSGLASAITRLFQPPRDTIRGVETTDWFGPLQPVRPIAPEGTEPRGWQYQPGQNLIYTPRAERRYKAEELRALAAYPLARMCIENVCDQITQKPLNIRLRRLPGESGKEYAKRKPDKGIIQAISDLFDNPNSQQSRKEFERQLLQDMLTGDWASVLIRTTAKKEIAELRAIDGSLITRYIDEQGYTPQPPNPAYAQVWYGIPMVDITTDQLLYAARNILSNELYGLSPTEQGAPEIEIGIQRLASTLNWYTAGTIPDAIQVIPPDATPTKIEEAQQLMVSELAGQIAKRRQLRLIQGFAKDGKDQIIFPKEKELADSFDELHIRKIAFLYGTSPQRLTKPMNRASAQAGQDAAEKEGTEPWEVWLASSVYNRLIAKMGFRKGQQQYEATFEEDSDVDPLKAAQIHEIKVKNGAETINEWREDDGQDPRPEEECDVPLIITATGPIPLSVDAQVDQEKTKIDAGIKPDPSEPPEPAVPTKKKPGAKPQPKKKVLKRQNIAIDPDSSHPHLTQARNRIESACRKVFSKQREKATTEAKRLLKARKGKLRKDEPSDESAEETAYLIYEAIETYWEQLPYEVESAIEEASRTGAAEGIIQLEISDGDMIQAANTIAQEYARKRAAELVGMKRTEDGELVPNPNAKWAISETTRDDLRELITDAFSKETPLDELVQNIAEAGMFSDSRAKLIANTEVANAQVSGNWSVWEKSGLVREVKWLTSADHVGPDECDDNEGQVVKFGDSFPSGHLHPPAHPRCMCSIVATKIDG